MQADAVSDEIRRQHVAFEELAEQHDSGNDDDRRPIQEELR
jgi:hypothetical protein